MEEVILRFHQIGKKIFEELDNQSLTKCREVNKSWRGFIDGEKTVPFRIIKSLTNVPDAYLDKKFGKVNLDSVTELMKDIQHVYSALHEVKQNFEMFFPGKELTYLKNHIAVLKQHSTSLDEKLIVQLVNTGQLVLTSKGLSKPNPINQLIVFGMTTLHYAAKNGYLNVCKLIAENVQEKNPKDFGGQTPLEMAEERGHSSVVEYFKTLLDVVEVPKQKKAKMKVTRF